MKKLLGLALCAVMMFSVGCLENGKNLSEESIEEIYTPYSMYNHRLDIEFETLMSDPAISANVNEMIVIMFRFRDKWQNEIERYLELMQSELDEDLWEMTEESQRRWEAYVESDLELTDRAYRHFYQGATIQRAYRAQYHYETYRARALHLITLYELLSADPNRV